MHDDESPQHAGARVCACNKSLPLSSLLRARRAAAADTTTRGHARSVDVVVVVLGEYFNTQCLRAACAALSPIAASLRVYVVATESHGVRPQPACQPVSENIKYVTPVRASERFAHTLRLCRRAHAENASPYARTHAAILD